MEATIFSCRVTICNSFRMKLHHAQVAHGAMYFEENFAFLSYVRWVLCDVDVRRIKHFFRISAAVKSNFVWLCHLTLLFHLLPPFKQQLECVTWKLLTINIKHRCILYKNQLKPALL